MKLVLIGGGDFGLTTDSPYNLQKIDSKIFEMTGKAHPRILFIGFNERANFIFGTLKKNFMALGAMCEYLKFTELSNAKTVDSKTKRADAIYIGGGNSIEYMQLIKDSGLDKFLGDALERGAILCGISAGAICYSKLGMSDAGLINSSDYKLVQGLDFADFMFCPHYSSSARAEKLPEFLKNLNEVAICCDDQVAVIIDGESYNVIKANESAKSFKCIFKGDKFIKEEILSGKVADLISI